MNTTGIYVGTFDPFTTGHANIVERAQQLFNRLVIGVVGDNVQKPQATPAEERAQHIRRLFADHDNIQVIIYHGLAIEAARSVGARFIVKGVRTARDFDYEREQADINRLISGGEVDTILLPAEPQLQSVSSTMVRELKHFGQDVTPFLPQTP